MARPKAVNSMQALDEFIDQTQQPDQPGAVFDPGQVGEDETPNDIALQMTMAQIGETAPEAKVIVYQINGETKKDIYLYDCTVTEFAEGGLKEIQECYGPGDYRVRVYYQNSILTHRRVNIGKSRVPPKPPVVESATPDFAALMAANNAAMMAGFKELAASMRPTAGNSMETIQLITALKPLLAPPPAYAPQTPTVDPLDMLVKLMALQKEIAPRESGSEISGGEIMLEAMKTFGKPIAEAMAQSKAREAQQAQQAQQYEALPNPIETPPAVAQDAQGTFPENPMSELQIKIAIFKPMLIFMAANQTDPYPCACQIVDTFTDEEIEKYINAPDWWKQLTTLIPEATPYRSWFDSLRDQITEILKSDENTDTVEEPPAKG